MNQIPPQGILLKAPLQTAMESAGGIAVLRRLRDELNNIRGAIEGLPRFGQAVPEERAQWKLVPTIDWFWVRIGIKGGLAAVAAIVCLKWIHPPGPANVPTWAWLFVVLRRTFVRLGGSSDLRSFQTAIYGSLILAGSAALLVFFTPLLASYAVMNVALFVVLFATGFFTARTRGITFWSEFTFLITSAFVALNPQVPVSSQTIIDSFVGIIFGLWIATVISRLVWPILPQRILRCTLIALFARMKALLVGPYRENLMTQLTDLPVEALRTLRQIQLAGCSREEKTKLAAVVNSLQRLVSRLGQLVSRRNLMPEIAQEILKPDFDRIEIEFKQMLDAFAEHFRKGHWPCEFPTVQRALIELDDTVQQIRHRDLLGHLPSETTLRLLDIIDCYHATADALQECGRLIGALRIDRYWGDFGL